MYDVIIIGKGPAGISASLYVARANQKCLIIGKDLGALAKAHTIQNYYGLEKPMKGKKLAEIGIEQAKNLGVEVVSEEVVGIDWNTTFFVKTVKHEYQAKAVILATGTERVTPPIAGLKEYEGKGVSYCAICDAFFYRDKDVAVIGNGNYAIHEARQLKPVVKSVTILTDGKEMIQNRDASDFDVEETPIREFRGTNSIEEVEFKNNNTKKIDGVFIAIGTASSTDLAKKIGALVQNNNIVVNENMETTVKGLYACGDCTGGLLQVNKAVYEGAKAALDIIKNI